MGGRGVRAATTQSVWYDVINCVMYSDAKCIQYF